MPRKPRRKSPTTVASVSAPAARCLTVEGAAAYLGAHVHAIRTLVWDKKVPHIRLGHRILFDIADLDRYIENQKSAVAQ